MSNFLCTRCSSIMCTDCKSIAGEYAQLLSIRTEALAIAQHTIQDLTTQLGDAKRQSKIWESMAKIGMPGIILKWMDAQAADPTAADGGTDINGDTEVKGENHEQ